MYMNERDLATKRLRRAPRLKPERSSPITKAPGPDGFHAFFYKRYWDVVGEEVFQFIKVVQFLEDTLREFNFPEPCIRLIMFCVMASRLSLLWNGERLPSFAAKRGLRQGDPLSPYLFVLCMERLSAAITTEVLAGRWNPVHNVRNGPGLTHLLFADDVLLFAKAKKDQVRILKEVLEKFCLASGLKGRVRNSDFNFVIDRINSRLADWKSKLLNRAGRVTLAQSVVSAMPSYCMSLAWIPQGVCNSLDSIVKNFIWKDRDGRGINLVGWDRIARPKKLGGLGLRKARDQNVALLGKNVWQVLCDVDKPWVKLLKSTYYPSSNFL
ncbi:hypothetical protein OROGR_017699 [Orobanche gracilis]